ncbi:MAG TPA: BON domain-containing protein, partial [Candidatus Binatia bacterium]|nr:BON domain-containing protein [Candidatus Binatia bacterium]
AAPKKNRATTWVQRVTILIIIAGAAAAVGKDTAYQAASRWTAALAQIVTPSSNTGTSANSLTDEKASSPTDDKKLNEPLVPVPGPDRPAQTEETPPAPRSDPKGRVRPESLPANGRNRPTANSTPRDAPPPHSSERNENLQHQVAKAIESRAIMGVEVSVVQGTAFLDGRVASERQRRAAERAARSVAGVERVRNRIAITWG